MRDPIKVYVALYNSLKNWLRILDDVGKEGIGVEIAPGVYKVTWTVENDQANIHRYTVNVRKTDNGEFIFDTED